MPGWSSGDTRPSSPPVLPSADHTTSCKRPPDLCHDRAPSFRMPLLLEVYDHPIAGLAKLMGKLGVGVERGEVPIVMTGVHDGQPCLAPRIEASRRNAAQFVSLGLLAVHAVDLQQHFHGRQHGWSGRPGGAQSPEPVGKCDTDHLTSPDAEALHRESTQKKRVLEVFQRFQLGVVGEPVRKLGTDARQRLEQLLGRRLASQPLKLRPTSGDDEFLDRRGNAFADCRNGDQAVTPPFGQNVGQGTVQGVDDVGGAAIGARPEAVAALLFEQIGIFAEALSNCSVDRVKADRGPVGLCSSAPRLDCGAGYCAQASLLRPVTKVAIASIQRTDPIRWLTRSRCWRVRRCE
jgi:hypothetical protein